mgnify:CR=1 FL=1
MKKTITAIAAAVALLGAAHATQPAGVSAAQSASQATAFSGTQGGSSLSVGINRQSATVEPSSAVGGATTILNQSAGAAAVQGGVKTSTFSAAGNYSTGAGTGGASASGVSTAGVDKEASYATGNLVSGTAKGNAEAISGSNADAGRNGAALVSAGAGAQFAASADSSRTGIFSTTRTANTAAGASANTSQPTTLTWGTGSFGVLNEGAANASATAKSGSVSSNN